MTEPDALVVRHRGWDRPETIPAMAGAPEADHRWSLTSRTMLRDGDGWMPVSGEIHYARVPRERWRERLLLMRSGGVDVISTYLFWIHHQPTPAAPSFSGGLDVAAFVRRCQELGLPVVLRIGPWCHGEVRNGGFPDWVQAAPVAHRTDDPDYLDLVRPWFAALGEQLGELCGPGGPVLGIQLENELYDQPGHLSTLKALAREVGLRAPLWTATAWGGAALPPEEVLPLYSGYGDGFWVEADGPWDTTFRHHFLPSREWDDPGVGADVRGVDAADVSVRLRDTTFPPATCELGGGMATTYHRRPVPSGADVAAVGGVKIASGSAWQGYYMYAGGQNPAGPPVQESHATGYPNDLPRFDYDFHAAIGAAGLPAPSHASLRRQHALLAAFGDRLGAMPASFPDRLPEGVDDTATLRWTMRSDGTSGFVFLTWHQPHVPLPDLTDVRLALALPGGRCELPAFDLPAGTTAVWPFALALGDITLAWATASALTLLDPTTLVLVAEHGVPVELVLEDDVVVSGPADRTASGAHRVGDAGGTLTLTRGAASATVVVVGAADAERVWVLPGEAGPLLVLSEDPVWTEQGELVVRSAGSRDGAPEVLVHRGGWHREVVAPSARPQRRHRLATHLEREAHEVPRGYGTFQGRASAPSSAEVERLAAIYRIEDAGAPSGGLGRRLLRVLWAGDVAELLVDGEVVADRFWDGTPWVVDLDTLPGAEADRVQLRILPLHREAEVWLPADALDRRRSEPGQLLALDEVTLTRTVEWRRGR